MAILSVTNETNPKLVDATINGSLNYRDKEGVLKEKTPKTAITEVAKDAANLLATQRGAVTVSTQDKNGDYHNYFVNKNADGTIVFSPTDNPREASSKIYFNKKEELDEKGQVKKFPDGQPMSYYILNTSSEAGKKFVENLGTREFQAENGEKYSNLAVRVTLKNDEIKNELLKRKEMGVDEPRAVISKDEVKFTTKAELLSSKSQTKEATQDLNKPKEQSLDR